MKFALLSAILPLAAALQSPYLSQLNGAGMATVNGGVNGGASFAPSLTSPSAELLELWSNQVSVELSASQLYLSASIWFRAREMDGMAAWMLEESGEERGKSTVVVYGTALPTHKRNVNRTNFSSHRLMKKDMGCRSWSLP